MARVTVRQLCLSRLTVWLSGPSRLLLADRIYIWRQPFQKPLCTSSIPLSIASCSRNIVASAVSREWFSCLILQHQFPKHSICLSLHTIAIPHYKPHSTSPSTKLRNSYLTPQFFLCYLIQSTPAETARDATQFAEACRKAKNSNPLPERRSRVGIVCFVTTCLQTPQVSLSIIKTSATHLLH